MGLIDDVNLEAVPRRTIVEVLDNGAGVVDFAIRRAVDLDHVERSALADFDAGCALAAGFRGGSFLAVKTARQDPRGGGLADAADAGEQEGVSDAPAAERLRQRTRHVLLPDQIRKTLRAPFARQNQM